MYDSIFGVFLYFAIPKVSNMVPKHGLGGRIRANLIPNHPQDPFFYRSPHAHRVCRRLPPIAFPLFSRGSAHHHRVFTFAPSRLVSTFAPSRLVVAELSALVGRIARGVVVRTGVRHESVIASRAGFSSRAGTTCVRPRVSSSRVPCPWRFGAPAGVIFLRALSSSARGSSSLHAARGHLLYPWRFEVFFLCFCRDHLRLFPVTVVTVFLPLVCLLQLFSHVIAAQHYCYQHYP
jgi:hypothetical protein